MDIVVNCDLACRALGTLAGLIGVRRRYSITPPKNCSCHYVLKYTPVALQLQAAGYNSRVTPLRVPHLYTFLSIFLPFHASTAQRNIAEFIFHQPNKP